MGKVDIRPWYAVFFAVWLVPVLIYLMASVLKLEGLAFIAWFLAPDGRTDRYDLIWILPLVLPILLLPFGVKLVRPTQG